MKLYDYEVTGVTDDTRNVQEGWAFVAIKGESFDGHNAARDMLSKGAAMVITERDLGLERQVIVENTRLAYAQAMSAFYNYPTSKLKLIAVTGTNGKSTVASLIKSILDSLGHKTGFIGTINYDTCGKVYNSVLSTPRQNELYSLFAEMVQNNAEYCVMEASSQALAQYRIAGERFEVGVFTNLTQDHLDYHKTMEAYYQAKKSLFDMCENALICIDNKYGKRLANELIITPQNNNVFTYSINELAGFYGVNIKTGGGGVSYRLMDTLTEQSFPMNFKMPGMFNVANSIASVAVCSLLGFDTGECVRALEKCGGVRGRSEVIYNGKFTVICDYAHTEDALVKILTSAREYAENRIICLFGAAGERDSEKRPIMGASAARLADYLIITSDNPRFEDPAAIISQVEEGCKKLMTPYKTFVDRKEAIEFALSEAQEGDIVLLCGKGHEVCQVIGDEEQPFDEREIVKQLIINN
ncbi:MAG: UDP-N-acetylmuramoyl-L-alanyl-D-glutamate--2,6-diaminopimelate ligase [Oscillospiraceae bacterium]|nr:UDP-N-acetylmuramoyl-L-alanyl-D-glutamate--2,6-diaminopimelate ligase [Oscillospiraceae bacterium]